MIADTAPILAEAKWPWVGFWQRWNWSVMYVFVFPVIFGGVAWLSRACANRVCQADDVEFLRREKEIVWVGILRCALADRCSYRCRRRFDRLRLLFVFGHNRARAFGPVTVYALGGCILANERPAAQLSISLKLSRWPVRNGAWVNFASITKWNRRFSWERQTHLAPRILDRRFALIVSSVPIVSLGVLQNFLPAVSQCPARGYYASPVEQPLPAQNVYPFDSSPKGRLVQNT